MPLPMKLYEIQDVVIADENTEVGARNERRIGAVNCSKSAGFEICHGLLDRVMQLLEVPWKGENGYSLQKVEGMAVVRIILFVCPNRTPELIQFSPFTTQTRHIFPTAVRTYCTRTL